MDVGYSRRERGRTKADKFSENRVGHRTFAWAPRGNIVVKTPIAKSGVREESRGHCNDKVLKIQVCRQVGHRTFVWAGRVIVASKLPIAKSGAGLETRIEFH